MAKPVENYVERFSSAIADLPVPVFSCNCVLNFLYGGLEGRRTAGMNGPMTFGEIGYQLLNQTLVYVTMMRGY